MKQKNYIGLFLLILLSILFICISRDKFNKTKNVVKSTQIEDTTNNTKPDTNNHISKITYGDCIEEQSEPEYDEDSDSKSEVTIDNTIANKTSVDTPKTKCHVETRRTSGRMVSTMLMTSSREYTILVCED